MDTNKIINFLKLIAEDLTPVSSARIAAAIVLKGKIISIGHNQYKSHPFAAKYSKHPEAIYLHAEADAINKAKKKLSENELKKAKLFIVRVKNDLQENLFYGIAKPCSGCAKCIEDHGIKTVIYTENSDDSILRYTTEIYK